MRNLLQMFKEAKYEAIAQSNAQLEEELQAKTQKPTISMTEDEVRKSTWTLKVLIRLRQQMARLSSGFTILNIHILIPMDC